MPVQHVMQITVFTGIRNDRQEKLFEQGSLLQIIICQLEY